MLFIQSNTLSRPLGDAARLRLLDALAARGRTPLARSARRRLFRLLTPQAPDTSELAAELERLSASRPAPEGADYTPGDLFSTADCVFFLVFGRAAGEELTAGVIYSVATAGPLARLERFCREVGDALREADEAAPRGTESASAGDAERARGVDGSGEAAEGPAEANEGESPGALRETPNWRPHSRGGAHALARFVAARPADFAAAAKVRGGARGLLRASELLEDGSVRSFLRRVQELRREGYSPRRLFAEAGGAGLPVEGMLEAGLLEREVRVSCRKSGHALFDLPTPDSLAAVTISRARCSLCAAPVADEIVEETINPTRLAVSLLEDGGWLANRLYQIVRSLGVPESEIATGPPAGHGESHLAASVCGNSFLFAARDGDLTPAFARRVAETVAETETEQLVVVTTGAVEEEGRLRLYEFAWRRARDGRDLGLTLVEGTAAAREEIGRAFEATLRRELSRRLFTLNHALGLDAADFVLDWFKLSAGAADPRASTADAAPVALLPRFAPLDGRAAS
jgi:hypothetical protein